MTTPAIAMTPIRPLVLLVDDDPTQLKLTTLRLRAEGFEVETAAEAVEALYKAKHCSPAAIVSDVLMSGLDGFGLCRLLRAEPSLDGVPVVLLSAHYRDTPDQELATRVGASALVARTPDFDDELVAIQAALAQGNRPRPTVPDPSVYEEHLRSNANQISRLLGRAKDAERRYHALLASSHELVAIMTPAGVVIEMNDRWRTLLGYDPTLMIGRNFRDNSPAEAVETYSTSYTQSLEGHRQKALPLPTADGRTLYIEFSNSMAELGGEPIVLSIGRDVTAQETAIRQLAAAEEKYRTLVERLPDVIWTMRADGTLTFLTPNAERIFGRPVAEVLAEGMAERMMVYHPDDRETVRVALEVFTAAGKPFDITYRRLKPTGDWVWLRNRSTSRYTIDGVLYLEGCISDITAQRELEDRLLQAQKMDAIGQLTGGIAHDFNNILAVILAHAECLTADLGTNDPRRTDAQEITEAADRAAALTRQLLAFSRKQMLEPRNLDLDATVAGIEKMLRRLIGEDIALAVRCGAGDTTVRADVGQLEQVIMNLVLNARDAMPTGGTLEIETHPLDATDPGVAARIGVDQGRYVMLSVSDTGTGIDAVTLERIFEPFFTTKDVGRGTGLGLATCYGIVKQSGGHIGVTSKVGVGSVFKVYLPCADAPAPAITRGPALAARGGRETILIIEDDAHVRAAVRRMMGPRGYQLLLADSASKALDLVATHEGPIHLVLSDVVMPNRFGPEVVAQIVKKHPEARVIYMSGYTDHPALRAGAMQPGTSFLQKPFGADTLANKIREVLDA
jgi:PAS domain S-box-containing protein